MLSLLIFSKVLVIYILHIAVFAIPSFGFQFEDLSLASIEAELVSLNSDYAMCTTSTKAFRIGPTSSEQFSCSPSILRITDLKTLHSDPSRPQALISGEIHGDERVGPLVSLTIAKLLAWSALCQLKESTEHCNILKNFFGIESIHSEWLAFLASRRDLLIIPTANCQGYNFRRRSENGVDPNRDFPYSRSDSKCFRSHTARLFNSLMRESLIQIVVTFHGGMVALGYEWGSRNHPSPKDKSPDDTVNAIVANRMSKYAGSFKGEVPYPVGRINSMVYPVDGGMEDWLYAGSWDKGMNKKCAGFDDEIAHNNRAIVYLVETSDAKAPSNARLGQSFDILNNKSPDGINGHIPRNVRLSLVPIDMLQPYVCIDSIGDYNGRHHSSSSTADAKRILSPTGKKLDLFWFSGGISTVEYTFLAWHQIPSGWSSDASSWNAANWGLYMDSLSPPVDLSVLKSLRRKRIHRMKQKLRKLDGRDASDLSNLVLRDYLDLDYPSGLEENTEGSVKFPPSKSYLASKIIVSIGASTPSLVSDNNAFPSRSKPFNATLTATLSATNANKTTDSHRLLPPGDYWLVAWTVADLEWGQSNQGHPQTPPQSYLSNARTNPQWRTESPSTDFNFNASRVVQGRTFWPSDPAVVRVFDDGDMQLQSVVLRCAWWKRALTTNPRPVEMTKEARDSGQDKPQEGKGPFRGGSFSNPVETAGSSFEPLTTSRLTPAFAHLTIVAFFGLAFALCLRRKRIRDWFDA